MLRGSSSCCSATTSVKSLTEHLWFEVPDRRGFINITPKIEELVPLITARSALILFVADLFHPLNHLTVERLLNGDMSHGGRWRSAVPMLLTRRKPDHI